MSEQVVSDFKGKDDLLIQSIDSLLAMDAKGILVPHGIGGHARTLLQAAKAALEQACAARMVPLHAEQIRVAAVAAIREVTGCPDIKGKDGAYLVDALIVNLLEPEAQEPKP